MRFASELMNPEPPTVSPELPVPELARFLLDQRIDGVCVVAGTELVGVVTTMDLVRREASVAIEPYVTLLDRLVPGGRKRKEDTISRVTGGTVGQIMTPHPKVVQYDASLEEIAALMVDDHISVVPVLRSGRLVGVILKPDVVRAALVLSDAAEAAADEAPPFTEETAPR